MLFTFYNDMQHDFVHFVSLYCMQKVEFKSLAKLAIKKPSSVARSVNTLTIGKLPTY